jgi:hypothetical protein
MFDLLVLAVTVFVIAGWGLIYADIRGQHVPLAGWVNTLRPRLYMWLWNRLYLDELYARVADTVVRVGRRVNMSMPEWLP